MRGRYGSCWGAVLKLYCSVCKTMTYSVKTTSAMVRCPNCGERISGRRQRAIWKELNDDLQRRIDAVEIDQSPRRTRDRRDTFFDD